MGAVIGYIVAIVALVALVAAIRVSRRESGLVKEHVKGYAEGRRLMRQGDGADEWYGMKVTREHLLALVEMGRDTEGRRVERAELVAILRTHNLRAEAKALEAPDA